MAIRGGWVVDGSGAPGFRGDVLVRDGVITGVGANAAQGQDDIDVIDATDLVVSPGFIDLHTHYDAQVFWDNTLSSSCWHGVTTVVGGNCGYSLAPTSPECHELLVELLHDIEDMSPETLRAGIAWQFDSFAEYLDSVERQGPYLNWAGYVGHSALRIAVMGQDAYSNRATQDQVGRMVDLARAALDAGAVGIATTTSPAGRNTPSRHAGRDEVVALLQCLSEAGHGLAAFVPGGDLDLGSLYELQPEIGRPFTWTALLAGDNDQHLDRVAVHREGFGAGADVHPQISCRKLVAQSTLGSSFAIRCPAMIELDRGTFEDRMAAYADPAWRQQIARELSVQTYATWDRWSVGESARHPELVGLPVLEAAARCGVDALNLVFDMSLEERLQTRFQLDLANRNEDAIRKLLHLEGAVLGLSDAGAHPDQLCDAVMSTDLLGGWVRDRQALTMEHAVRKLSGEIADLVALPGRGYLREGYHADVVVFDPATVGPGPFRRRRDFPADGERIVADAPTGVQHIFVNGTAITRDGMSLAGHLERAPDRCSARRRGADEARVAVVTITADTDVTVDLDPIMVEIFRTRLEAVSMEAGAAVENTAISPIVTETKDYAVTLLHGDGRFMGGTAAITGHFGVAMHAVTRTLARHGATIAEGDVFVANDPHTDGGFHPQDVVVQRPVFLEGELVAWVAISAHMLDMGGMVPGSSATEATECYQEALRFPSVRLFRAGVECEDMWEMLRTNLRSFDVIEMDMRSLVIGAHVAGEKVRELAIEVGLEAFRGWSRMLDVVTGAEFGRRLGALEPGSYTSTAFAEVGEGLQQLPCTLHVGDGRLTFDLTGAPPQVPHFVNSKPYILRAVLVPALLGFLAPDLPLTHSVYEAIDLLTTPGTILDCRSPAPIGAAHIDCTIAVNSAAIQCIQLAVAASARASAPRTGPLYDAQGTTRWSFLNETGNRTLFTLLDGMAGGSPAGFDRDGTDMFRDLVGRRGSLQTADVEITESVYRVLYRSRGVCFRPAGAGAHRAGAGCRTVLEAHGVAALDGNMTGTRGWFPCAGMAGGRPGALMSFRIVRADGRVEQLGMHDTGIALHEGDRFELSAATGGGYGDPLDRPPAAVAADLGTGRISISEATEFYGVVLTDDGQVDGLATETQRSALLRHRLALASPVVSAQAGPVTAGEEWPLFPGVVRRGRYAVSWRSGAILAVAPAHWTEGCPVLEEPYEGPGPLALVLRSYLDPFTGHALHTELAPQGSPRSFATMPSHWVQA